MAEILMGGTDQYGVEFQCSEQLNHTLVHPHAWPVFEAGDVVECVVTEACSRTLTLGRTYVVLGCHEWGFVTVRNDESVVTNYYSFRFSMTTFTTRVHYNRKKLRRIRIEKEE